MLLGKFNHILWYTCRLRNLGALKHPSVTALT